MSRLDKYLWAIRVFKTRSDSSESCKSGRVKVNGIEAKPSREVKEGDLIEVRKIPITYTYKVLALLENRQPAKNVPLYAENLTPAEELEKLDRRKETVFIYRERGTGRPTKKDRRDIDKLRDQL